MKVILKISVYIDSLERPAINENGDEFYPDPGPVKLFVENDADNFCRAIDKFISERQAAAFENCVVKIDENNNKLVIMITMDTYKDTNDLQFSDLIEDMFTFEIDPLFKKFGYKLTESDYDIL